MAVLAVLNFFNPFTPYEQSIPIEDGWKVPHGPLRQAFMQQHRSADDLLAVSFGEGVDPSGNYMTSIRAEILAGHIHSYEDLRYFAINLAPDPGRGILQDYKISVKKLNQMFEQAYQIVFEKENQRRRLRNSFIKSLDEKAFQLRENGNFFNGNFFTGIGKIGQIAANVLFFPTDCFHVKRMPLVKSIAASYCITTIVEAVFPWALIPIALLPTCNMFLFLFKAEVTFATGSWMAGYGFRLITPSNMIGVCKYLFKI